MRKISIIIKDLLKIYEADGKDAEEYLKKARKLKEKFGPGFAIAYCWFYSVPQKWTQIEPQIFELARYTNSFDLNTILSMPNEKIIKILRPMIFYNKISIQFKKFCKAIKEEYHSWDNFAEELMKESIFIIFEKLRKYKGTRITFKNLSAMKIFIGRDNDLFILDTHVAKVFGLSRKEQGKYKVKKELFKNLLDLSIKITNKLKDEGLNQITVASWSLAIWFNKAKIRAQKLLSMMNN
jgi:endonuclease III-like uncharacterized protein